MQFDNQDIVKRIHSYCKDNKLTLSIAESCTGGMISSMITDIDGASEFFDSAMITYSNGAKSDLVSVKSVTLINEGAVSEETAREMAEGIRKSRNTDLALSATGNLGPSAMEGKEVGLVYFAVASQRGTSSVGTQFQGTRRQVKKKAALFGLDFLLQVLSA